jgi:hypothetical protein
MTSDIVEYLPFTVLMTLKELIHYFYFMGTGTEISSGINAGITSGLVTNNNRIMFEKSHLTGSLRRWLAE